MRYKLFLLSLLALTACGRSSSGSRQPGTEVVMDFFTGYHSGRYRSETGEIYGVSTGGPTAMDIRQFDGDFCLLLWGPPRKVPNSDHLYLSGQKCKGGKFGYNHWKLRYRRSNTKQLFMVAPPEKAGVNGKVTNLTYIE